MDFSHLNAENPEMPQPEAEPVSEAVRRLMAIDGVTGVMPQDGKLVVLLSDPRAAQSLPAEVDGMKVASEFTGQIRAL